MMFIFDVLPLELANMKPQIYLKNANLNKKSGSLKDKKSVKFFSFLLKK